ncbi:MAG: chromosomal replication initiator protein [Pirellulaceae bacterium]
MAFAIAVRAGIRKEVAKDDKEIVSVFKRKLAGRVGIDRYQVWLRSLHFRLDGRQLVVAARNQFGVERIKALFHADLIEVAADAFGPDVRLHYEIQDSQSAEPAVLTVHRVDSHEPAGGATPAPVAGSQQRSDSQSRDQQQSSNSASPDLKTARPKPYQSLNSFVVGDCNRVAYTAAANVVQRLGQVSPVFFYGPNGVGKTHLLEGILTSVRKVAGFRRCVYLSAEQFTSQFLQALHGAGLPSFRRKYRDVELLILDDIQFFANKPATITELHHTIDSLLRAGKQLVLAGDRPPAELAGLSSDLIARMAGGLICPVNPADHVTRKGILNRLNQSRGLLMSDEVIELLSRELIGDARMLSGAMNRIELSQQAYQQTATVDSVQSILSDLFSCTQRAVQLQDIERVVCDVFGLEAKSLQSDRRTKAISHPRMLAMWLARKYTRAAYSEIGNFFGQRSHSTVISAQKKVNRWVSNGDSIPLAHGQCNVEDAIRRVELQLRTG